MTVCELIEKLKAMPSGAEVKIGIDVIEAGHEMSDPETVDLDGKDVWIE